MVNTHATNPIGRPVFVAPQVDNSGKNNAQNSPSGSEIQSSEEDETSEHEEDFSPGSAPLDQSPPNPHAPSSPTSDRSSPARTISPASTGSSTPARFAMRSSTAQSPTQMVTGSAASSPRYPSRSVSPTADSESGAAHSSGSAKSFAPLAPVAPVVQTSRPATRASKGVHKPKNILTVMFAGAFQL